MSLMIPTYRISWHFKFTKLRQLWNMQLSIWNPLLYILISYITFYKLVSVMYHHIWVWAVHDCVTYFSCSGNDVTFFCSLFVVYGNMGCWVSKEGIKISTRKGNFCILWLNIAKSRQKLGIILENKVLQKKRSYQKISIIFLYCKLLFWMKNKSEISERSEQFLVTECFFNLFLEVTHI